MTPGIYDSGIRKPKYVQRLRMATPDVVSKSWMNNGHVLISTRLLHSYYVWADFRRRPDWNGNKWFHLRRVSVFYDKTEEGGCMTNVRADELCELHEINETDGNASTFKQTMTNRISTNELSNVTNQKIERKNLT
jgi:hypothetical protein